MQFFLFFPLLWKFPPEKVKRANPHGGVVCVILRCRGRSESGGKRLLSLQRKRSRDTHTTCSRNKEKNVLWRFCRAGKRRHEVDEELKVGLLSLRIEESEAQSGVYEAQWSTAVKKMEMKSKPVLDKGNRSS